MVLPERLKAGALLELSRKWSVKVPIMVFRPMEPHVIITPVRRPVSSGL